MYPKTFKYRGISLTDCIFSFTRSISNLFTYWHTAMKKIFVQIEDINSVLSKLYMVMLIPAANESKILFLDLTS